MLELWHNASTNVCLSINNTENKSVNNVIPLLCQAWHLKQRFICKQCRAQYKCFPTENTCNWVIKHLNFKVCVFKGFCFIIFFSSNIQDHQFSIMSHANALQHRGGLDFVALARGGERSYSTSYLVKSFVLTNNGCDSSVIKLLCTTKLFSCYL
jgi:hypothetical protein